MLVVLCRCVFGLLWLFLWFFLVKILHSIRVSLHFEFPVVDRLCLVLARQCRKKNLTGIVVLQEEVKEVQIT